MPGWLGEPVPDHCAQYRGELGPDLAGGDPRALSTLDSALSVLDALQATRRQVGVISHVPALVKRVVAHVRVVQRGGGHIDVIVA